MHSLYYSDVSGPLFERKSGLPSATFLHDDSNSCYSDKQQWVIGENRQSNSVPVQGDENVHGVEEL